MQKPQNMVIVIFGASGDLTHRKLIPSLYALYDQKMMPDHFLILGVGRSSYTDQAFRDRMMQGVRSFSELNHLNESELLQFQQSIAYQQLDPSKAEDFPRLKIRLDAWTEETGSPANYLYYLSLLPSAFAEIASNLAAVGLNHSTDGFRRLVVEKPFGYDLESGRKLNDDLHKAFEESQIFRIDHYLGKETVQNLLVMRFSNGIFEPLWNRNYIHHVEITSAESIGVEGRGGYYDGSGALRDMLQNHLLQVASFVAMEPPSSMDADAIRNETLKVLQSLKPLRNEDVANHVIRGQYVGAHVRGIWLPGYREEEGVPSDSRTETYVALKFFIDNWRWGGVPFYIRTGKRLPTRVTEVVIHFKPTPHTLFQRDHVCQHCNTLIIRIQPDEGILMRFGMKQPGAGFHVKPVHMDFHYTELSDQHLPSAYERLLYDAMLGDSTLYARADAVEAAWQFVAPIQHMWKTDPGQKIHGYPAGTWGPEHADGLIEDSCMGWRYPCKNLADDGEYCEL